MQFWNLKLKLFIKCCSDSRVQYCMAFAEFFFIFVMTLKHPSGIPWSIIALSLLFGTFGIIETKPCSSPKPIPNHLNYRVANMILAKPTKVILHRTYMIANIRRNKRFLWAGNRRLEAETNDSCGLETAASRHARRSFN